MYMRDTETLPPTPLHTHTCRTDSEIERGIEVYKGDELGMK